MSTAIVTGHTSGLGKSLAEGLLARGWTVVGVSRNSELAPPSDGDAQRLIEVRGSVDEQVTVEAAFAQADRLGDLRLVVNCAGQGAFGEPGCYSAQEIKDVMAGNLIGLILVSDFAVRAMANSGGDIVNVMSTAAKKLRTAESVYTASKWGAKAYTRTLRDALKATKSPIRVFEVYPCGMNTPFWRTAARPVADGAGFPQPEAIAATILSAVMDQKGPYPQELTFERG